MIECQDVTKRLGDLATGSEPLWRLDRLTVEDGERVMISGPSGCGKTTFINLVAGLLVPDSGEVTVAGVRVDRVSRPESDLFRGRNVGVVAQSFQLLSHLTVMDNLLLASRYGRRFGRHEARERAEKLIAEVGLADRRDYLASRLSIGEQQRVALARSVINAPPLLLADEPTASLDARNAEIVLDMLFELCEHESATLVVVTHDTSLAGRFDRVISAAGWMSGAESATGQQQREVQHV